MYTLTSDSNPQSYHCTTGTTRVGLRHNVMSNQITKTHGSVAYSKQLDRNFIVKTLCDQWAVPIWLFNQEQATSNCLCEHYTMIKIIDSFQSLHGLGCAAFKMCILQDAYQGNALQSTSPKLLALYVIDVARLVFFRIMFRFPS